MKFYANSIVAPESLMREKPQVVRGFVQASLRALEWTLDNPKEMAAILKKYNPELDEGVAAAEIPILKQMVWNDATKKNGLGYLDPAQVKITRDLMKETFELKSEVAVEDLYTNEFVPRKP